MAEGLDERWRGWLRENLDRKCDPAELADILSKHGFSPAAIRKAMGARCPAHLAPGEETGAKIDYEALAARAAASLEKLPGAARVRTSAAQVYTIEDFLSERECAGLVNIIERHLRASTITVASEDKYFRTSQTCDLGNLKHAVVKDVDLKIARALGVRRAYSENIQAQQYDVGQEFKAHTDFFEPATEEYAKFASAMGNRTWTFMIYLSDVEKGGGTRFFKLGKTFSPKKGLAVVWNNLLPDGSPNRKTLHAGEPVRTGRKTIITKWFREKGSGRMFY